MSKSRRSLTLQTAALVAVFFATAVGFHFFFPVLNGSAHLTHKMTVAGLAFLGTFVLVFAAIFSARFGKNGFEVNPWFGGWIVGGLAFFWLGVLFLGRLRYGIVGSTAWSGIMLVMWLDVRRDRRRGPVEVQRRRVEVHHRTHVP